VALLVPNQTARRRSDWRIPTLAGLLALPSLGIFFVGVNFWLYVGSAWTLTLGALALGLFASAPRR
jgi:hypothetical protein